MTKNGTKAGNSLKSLNTLLRKPDATQVQEKNEKTLGLKIMSLDLNTLDAKK